MRGLANFFLFVLVTATVCAGVAGAAYLMSERYGTDEAGDAHAEPVDPSGVTPTTAAVPVTEPAPMTDTVPGADPGQTATARPTAAPNVTATPSATSTPAFTTWTISSQINVNVRDCPTQTCARIALLRPGDTIHVLDTVDDWHEILLDDGRIGYVAANLTREATPAP